MYHCCKTTPATEFGNFVFRSFKFVAWLAMSNTQAPPPIAPVAPAARTGAPTVRVFAMHLQKKKTVFVQCLKSSFSGALFSL
jgi:hypothetical protein